MSQEGQKNKDSNRPGEGGEDTLQILQNDGNCQYDKDQSNIQPGFIALPYPIEQRTPS
jgi:hypothetical protein